MPSTQRFDAMAWPAGLVAAVACAAPVALAQAPVSSAPAAAGANLAAGPADATLQVDRYLVNGNRLLPDPAIQAALQPFTGRRTPAELRAAARAVQALYRDAGFGAVLVYLPEQAPVDGSVRIEVVEGRIRTVKVEGNRQFDDANILRSLPDLVPGRTPEVRVLDAQVQLANENPAKNLRVFLQPGDQAGEVEAQVRVTEQPVQRWLASLDNSGSEQTGRWRATLGWQHAALWGLDHVLSLQVQTAPESPDKVAVVSAAYHAPLYGAGLTVDAFAAHSDIDGGTTNTAAGNLQFSGRGEVVGVRVNRNLARRGEIDQRLSLGLEHRDYLNDCSIAGLPAGACGPAGESVSVQPLTLGYTLQGPTFDLLLPFSVNLALHHNLQLGGGHSASERFEAVRPGAEPRYTLLRWGVQGGVALPAQWSLQARLLGQWSAHALVPGEQFGLGGSNTLRGYEEREVTGDSGTSLALELQSPDLAAALGLGRGRLRVLGFADAGEVRNRLDTPCLASDARCFLAAVGVGLRGSFGGFQWRLDLAHALRTAATTGRSDTRVHAALDCAF